MEDFGYLHRSPASLPPLATTAGRRVAAAALTRASAVLARFASLLLRTDDCRAARTEPVIEFHSEAGALEGALFVDGKLVGWIDGVRRL